MTSTSSTRRQAWRFALLLGLPLTVVGAAAMFISYATLIDVARVHGLPLPELFPILVDVGTVTAMIAAAQFTIRAIPGRWLAYATFVGLSLVSIAANALHAVRVADLRVTTPEAAAALAAIPPLTLLAVTHLVMRLLPSVQAPDAAADAELEDERVEQALPTQPRRDGNPTRQPATDAPTLHLVEPETSKPAATPNIAETEGAEDDLAARFTALLGR